MNRYTAQHYPPPPQVGENVGLNVLPGNDVRDIRQIYVIILSVWKQMDKTSASWISVKLSVLLQHGQGPQTAWERDGSQTQCLSYGLCMGRLWHDQPIDFMFSSEFQHFDLQSHETASRLLIWACNRPNHRRLVSSEGARFKVCEHAWEHRL